MPLILKVYKKPVFKNKVGVIRNVPFFSIGINYIHHKFRDEIINNDCFCKALSLGNVEIIDDTALASPIVDVLSTILNIDKKQLSMDSRIWNLIYDTPRSSLFYDFIPQIETAYGVTFHCPLRNNIEGMTVKELQQLVIK